jgi:hypothetical protein
MRFQSLNPPPPDARSIPWSSLVLPLITPGGGRAEGGPNKSLYLGLDSVATAWGAVPQPRLRTRQVFIAGLSGEAQTCVCSPSSSRDSTDLKGQL